MVVKRMGEGEMKLSDKIRSFEIADVCVGLCVPASDPVERSTFFGFNGGLEYAAKIVEESGIEDRLDYLNRWLESRGLPLTWAGKMTAARFIAIEERVVNADTWDAYGESYITGSYIGEEYRWAGDIRWDHAKPEDRAEALKLDAAKDAK